jgi:hypothetical protein
MIASGELPQPCRWTVRVNEGQQGKAKRQAVYDALRRHRVRHPVASRTANIVHAGVASEVEVEDAETARAVVADLQAHGIAAEAVAQPV